MTRAAAPCDVNGYLASDAKPPDPSQIKFLLANRERSVLEKHASFALMDADILQRVLECDCLECEFFITIDFVSPFIVTSGPGRLPIRVDE